MFGGAATLASARSKAEHAVEQQRQLLVVQHRRDVDAVGHLEHEADEGRLHRGADAHRRLLLRGVDRAAAREARARRRAPAPPVRERPPAGSAGGGPVQLSGRKSTKIRSPAVMVLTVARRASDSRIADAVGVAPRRADIVGHGVRQFVDGNIHRALEVDDDDRARGRNLGSRRPRPASTPAARIRLRP